MWVQEQTPKRHTCLKDIGLCAQNMRSILNSMINIIFVCKIWCIMESIICDVWSKCQVTVCLLPLVCITSCRLLGLNSITYPRGLPIPTQQNYFPHKTCHVSWLHLSQPTCIPTWKLYSGTWEDGIESPLRYMNRAKHEDIYDIELSRYESYNKCVPQISLQKKCGSLSMVLFH